MSGKESEHRKNERTKKRKPKGSALTPAAANSMPGKDLLEHQRIWVAPGAPGRKRVPFSIQGSSTAARETGFDVVEWGIGLDAGIPTRKQRRAVLVTHTHPDHVQELPRTCLNSDDTFNVFCPPAAERPIQRHLESYAGLRGCTDKIRYHSRLFSGKVVTLAPTDGWTGMCVVHERSLTPPRAPVDDAVAAKGDCCGRQAKRRKKEKPKSMKTELVAGKLHPGTPPAHARLMVRSVPLRHTVDTVGYLIGEKRHRLLPELAAEHAEVQAFQGAEADAVEMRKAFRAKIVALRKAGQPVDQEVIAPMLAFLCDGTSESTVEAVRNVCSEPAGKPLVIMCECTFISDDDAQQAVSRRHVLWSKLKPVTQEHSDVIFLLVHFSHRYRDEGVLSEFAKTLPHNVDAFL